MAEYSIEWVNEGHLGLSVWIMAIYVLMRGGLSTEAIVEPWLEISGSLISCGTKILLCNHLLN